MAIFKKYSEYYDMLYEDKDYKSEACYVDGLISRYRYSEGKSILDIGCGTGRHDRFFAEMGYSVIGIDKSPGMIKVAKETALPERPPIEFMVCDAVDFDLKRRFDSAVALFHVMSYQTHNSSFLKVIRNVYKHLKSKGLFVFDFWYGPGVINHKPSVRVKNIQKNGMRIKRTAVPSINYDENKVDIEFHVAIEDKKSGRREVIRETHKMRYFFRPELELMLEKVGFRDIMFLKWMSNSHGLDEKSWSGVAIARK